MQPRGLIPAHAGKTPGGSRTRAARRAHPRSRGENVDSAFYQLIHEGSSPLTRGKRISGLVIGGISGLIPAHAGKTQCWRADPHGSEAHPRSRGENAYSKCAGDAQSGSSPLTRGKPANAGDERDRAGLIPAHAGKTQRLPRSRHAARAHPRSRGENSDRAVPEGPERGSSPLTRGKPACLAGAISATRLIPAHAGKTPTLVYESASARAHPRSRGENGALNLVALAAVGSSPLTRGKPSPGIRRSVRAGLIPAHAGKTRFRTRMLGCRGAHPRSRGENYLPFSPAKKGPGSSPLTRGKRFPGDANLAALGLIPAHAGKTRPCAKPGHPPRAHPRSRGENFAASWAAVSVWGSSPLTRGKHSETFPIYNGVGLIPAHAGKTITLRSPTRPGRAHPRSRGENSRLLYTCGMPSGSSPLTRGKRPLTNHR